MRHYLAESEEYKVLGNYDLSLVTYLSLPWREGLFEAEVTLCAYPTVGCVHFRSFRLVEAGLVGVVEILKRRASVLLLRENVTGKVFLSRICGGRFWRK